METFVKLVIMRNLTVLNYEYFKFRKNGSEMVPFSKQHVYKRWKQESYVQESTAFTLFVICGFGVALQKLVFCNVPKFSIFYTGNMA